MKEDPWRFVKTNPPPLGEKVVATDGKYYSVGFFEEASKGSRSCFYFTHSNAIELDDECYSKCKIKMDEPSYWKPIGRVSIFQEIKAQIRAKFLDIVGRIHMRKVNENGREGLQLCQITKVYKEALKDGWQPFED